MHLCKHSYPPYKHQSYYEAQKSLFTDYEIQYGWEQYYATITTKNSAKANEHKVAYLN